MKHIQTKSIFGDIAGGTVAGVFGLPGNILFGLIAFAPLGDAYAGAGIMAAMYSTIIVCFITGGLGNAAGMISGPKSSTCLIFAAVISQSGLLHHMGEDPAGPSLALLALPFLVVLLSGMIQVLIGVLRLGNIVKYIPYPVLAGILNGTVVVILSNQLWPLLGIEKGASLTDLWYALPRALPLNTALVVFSALVMYGWPKLNTKVPGSLVAILVSSAAYHMLEMAGFGGMAGPVLGRIEFIPPSPAMGVEIWKSIAGGIPVNLMTGLFFAAATIAILNSMGTLLAMLSIQDRTDTRSDNNRLMIAEGVGNMVSACFGGLAASGYVLRSRVNFQSGGRTRLSSMAYAVVVFLCISFFARYMGMIPKAVMTGVIIMALLGIFDKWSLALFKKFIFGSPDTRKYLAGNLGVVLLVMAVCIFYHPVAAVLIGILVSVVLFMVEMSKSLIRREYRSNAVHSKMYRNETFMELLREHGHRIAVLELEGPIYFGSGDLLADRIDILSEEGADWIILDMKRVSAFDGTGARIIVRSIRAMKKNNRTVAVSYVQEGSSIWHSLRDAGLPLALSKRICFRDTDIALEFFEDCLLDEVCPSRRRDGEFPLTAFGILKGISPDEIKLFTSFLTPHRYREGEIVFRQGDRGNAIYFIVKGSVDVNINITLAGAAQKKRLQILSAGTIFGEMALIDGKPRSADVQARENLTCLKMNLEGFKELTASHPGIAIRIVTGMARVLSERLRSSHVMISELET